MAASKVDKALDDIEKWTVLELVEFTKNAEERWGVSARRRGCAGCGDRR
jgi:ribosomal protein L7/L12